MDFIIGFILEIWKLETQVGEVTSAGGPAGDGGVSLPAETPRSAAPSILPGTNLITCD